MVGSDSTVDVGGTYCGASSARPMQAPESRPVHGTPSISGMSGFAAEVVNGDGELGTSEGTHSPVNSSASSPVAHDATTDPETAGATANAVTAGAAIAASANAEARTVRRTENSVGFMRVNCRAAGGH